MTSHVRYAFKLTRALLQFERLRARGGEGRAEEGDLARTFDQRSLDGAVDDDVLHAVRTQAYKTLCVIAERANHFSPRTSRSAAVISLGGHFCNGETHFTAQTLAAGMQRLLGRAEAAIRQLLADHAYCRPLLDLCPASRPDQPGIYVSSVYPSHASSAELEWSLLPRPGEAPVSRQLVCNAVLEHVFRSWSLVAPATSGASAWQQRCDDLSTLLYAVVQFCGPPPRAPELCAANQRQLPGAAGGARRSVDWLRSQNALVLILHYNKATHRNDRPGAVTRALPSRVSQLLLVYVGVVAPVSQAFRVWSLGRERDPSSVAAIDHEHSALFVVRGARVTPRVANAAVERHWSEALGCNASSRSLRQLFAFLTRADHSPLLEIIARQEMAQPVQAVRQLRATMALMFGHSAATHCSSYGQDAAGDAAAPVGETLDERVAVMRAFEELFGIARVSACSPD